MDDKEFEEIMQKYVASTSRGKETDFKKLRQLQSQRQVPQRRKSFKPKYALVGVLCSIILVLAVVLPTTLIKQDDVDKSEIIYSNIEDIRATIVESINVLKDNYNLNAIYANVGDVSASSVLLSKKDNAIIGAYIIADGSDGNISKVSNFIINKKYILNDFKQYYEFPRKVSWGEYTVGYAMILDEASNNMKYQIYFTDGNYDYFLNVTGRIGMEIEDILNTLYTE